jgi:hypothetical protein
MMGRLKAFFAKLGAGEQKRTDDEYTTMTPEEREVAEGGSRGGATGGAEAYERREAERSEDAWEGRPPPEL